MCACASDDVNVSACSCATSANTIGVDDESTNDDCAACSCDCVSASCSCTSRCVDHVTASDTSAIGYVSCSPCSSHSTNSSASRHCGCATSTSSSCRHRCTIATDHVTMTSDDANHCYDDRRLMRPSRVDCDDSCCPASVTVVLTTTRLSSQRHCSFSCHQRLQCLTSFFV